MSYRKINKDQLIDDLHALADKVSYGQDINSLMDNITSIILRIEFDHYDQPSVPPDLTLVTTNIVSIEKKMKAANNIPLVPLVNRYSGNSVSSIEILDEYDVPEYHPYELFDGMVDNGVNDYE